MVGRCQPFCDPIGRPGIWVPISPPFSGVSPVPAAEADKRLIQIQPGHTYAQQVFKAFQTELRNDTFSGPDAKKRPQLSEQAPASILTQRQIELLPLLAEGRSNKEIAAKRYISPVTVQTHLQNIYGKLHAKGRIEALRKARELGIISFD